MEKKNDTQYGVIHEIGDLGLGFDPVTKEENKILQENEQKKDKENK